jgi:hypothetical protein
VCHLLFNFWENIENSLHFCSNGVIIGLPH